MLYLLQGMPCFIKGDLLVEARSLLRARERVGLDRAGVVDGDADRRLMALRRGRGPTTTTPSDGPATMGATARAKQQLFW